MNYLHVACALASIGAIAVPSASIAATSTLDTRIAGANHIAAISASHHISARISGLLGFCGQDTLRDAVDQKIIGDVMSDGDVMAGSKAGSVDFVQVIQSLQSYSDGVAMGLILAVVPAGKKKEICAKTMEMAENLLKQPHPLSNP